MRLHVNDIMLNVEVTGAGPGLLLLHGFTGSIKTWASHVDVFARHRRVITVDLIGHGQSDAPADAQRYQMERCVEDLVRVLDLLAVTDVEVLGYSMGGRVALHLAAAVPARIKALVLESSSPGLDDASERQARIAADEALADSIERDGLEAFIDRWEQLPLFASQQGLPAEVRERLRFQRLQNSPLGLAKSLRGMGTGRQASLWHKLAIVSMPALLIVGSLDRKYCEIAHSMAAMLPKVQVAVVPDAGHTIHLEQAATFNRIVLEFLLTKGE
jgi:2-succinyl-6-hydroxy-2,4-cyclohexadiene-1-carboxylate synthase